MAKNTYTVKYVATIEYEQEVEADSEDAAFELVYAELEHLAFQPAFETNTWTEWDDAVVTLTEEGEEEEDSNEDS